jgi:hypothetical protein
MCNITLLGNLRVISAVIKSWPGDLPNRNFCINYFTVFGVNGLGGSVIGSGLSRKFTILFSMEGLVESFGLKTWER